MLLYFIFYFANVYIIFTAQKKVDFDTKKRFAQSWLLIVCLKKGFKNTIHTTAILCCQEKQDLVIFNTYGNDYTTLFRATFPSAILATNIAETKSPLALNSVAIGSIMFL
jgi:hypothetical protein